MKLISLKRELRDLELNNIQVHDLVTDRHVMVKSYMQKDRPTFNHYSCLAHCERYGSKYKIEYILFWCHYIYLLLQFCVFPRTIKKTRKCSKNKNVELAKLDQGLIKGIVNHTYWLAASSGVDEQPNLENWKSINNTLLTFTTPNQKFTPSVNMEYLNPDTGDKM